MVYSNLLHNLYHAQIIFLSALQIFMNFELLNNLIHLFLISVFFSVISLHKCYILLYIIFPLPFRSSSRSECYGFPFPTFLCYPIFLQYFQMSEPSNPTFNFSYYIFFYLFTNFFVIYNSWRAISWFMHIKVSDNIFSNHQW